MISRKGTPPHIALIGVSGYAITYVTWLLAAHKSQRVRVIALSVLIAEQDLPQVKEFQLLGAKIFDSYEELLASKAVLIDLCCIPTGIPWHARMTSSALRSGCNVLVEKPLAGSLHDVETVRAAELETGNWVAVGFQDMYTQEIADLKRSLVGGAIGKIETIAAFGAWPRTDSYYSRNRWAGKVEDAGARVSDSPLNNAFAHFINLSLYLASPEEESSSLVELVRADLYRAHAIETFDTAVVTAASIDGAKFWFGVSHACKTSVEPIIRIVGSEGQVEWSHKGKCEILAKGKVTQSTPVPNYEFTRNQMFENVLARLDKPSTRICSTTIAKSHTFLIEQIHTSGTVKTVDEVEIEHVCVDGGKSSVPAIINIESRLSAAFESLSPLEDIVCLAASA